MCIHRDSERGKHGRGAVWRRKQTKHCSSVGHAVTLRCAQQLCVSKGCRAAAVTLWAHEVQTKLWCGRRELSVVWLTLSMRALASLVYQRWELCVCCLLVKAESSGVYIVHVLLVVTNLMRVFSLIQNILWLWHFMFLPLSKLQNGACKTSSPLGHAVFNPGIPRYVIWWVSWIFS